MSEAEHDRVTAAVQAAEAGTSGEIVTIVTDASDRYGDVALWWSALVAMLALAAYAAYPDFYLGLVDRATDNWGREWSTADILRFATLGALIKFLAMRALLLWRPLLIAITPPFIKAERVRRRAVHYFKVGAERRTAGRTGILFYLSMAERRAEIVADEAIHAKVSQDRWAEAMADLLADVREGRIADGMVAAIGDVGVILAAELPQAAGDTNELPDRLIEL